MNLRPLLLAFTLLVENGVFAAPMQVAPTQEQSDFSTEGGVARNIPLPPAIRKLLERDSFIREILSSESPPQTSLPKDWTLCSVVHLASNTEPDYVVIGQNSLTGAHATHFWVYRETPQEMKLALTVFADGLSVNKQKNNGMHNVTVTWLTGVSVKQVLYVFDGNKYQALRRSSR
jgi:hypothetical protein